MKPLKDRFFAKVNKDAPNGCWEWVGARNNKGYGALYMKEGTAKAHRISWVIHNGSIPDGLCVLHKCDNPPCINPNHLFLGTRLDNSRDCCEKRRIGYGSERPNSKLTENDVRAIKRLIRGKTLTQTKIAVKFGVGQSQIACINTGRTWTHV